MCWINPSIAPQDDGYVPLVIREILSGSRWFGRGVGAISRFFAVQYIMSILVNLSIVPTATVTIPLTN